MQITVVLLTIMTILITNYWKIITSYDKNLLRITAKIYYKLLQKIITNYGSSYFCKIQNYYKLRQALLHRQLLVLLQITANFITNYGGYYKLQRYYKLRRNNYKPVAYKKTLVMVVM